MGRWVNYEERRQPIRTRVLGPAGAVKALGYALDRCLAGEEVGRNLKMAKGAFEAGKACLTPELACEFMERLERIALAQNRDYRASLGAIDLAFRIGAHSSGGVLPTSFKGVIQGEAPVVADVAAPVVDAGAEQLARLEALKKRVEAEGGSAAS